MFHCNGALPRCPPMPRPKSPSRAEGMEAANAKYRPSRRGHWAERLPSRLGGRVLSERVCGLGPLVRLPRRVSPLVGTSRRARLTWHASRNPARRFIHDGAPGLRFSRPILMSLFLSIIVIGAILTAAAIVAHYAASGP